MNDFAVISYLYTPTQANLPKITLTVRSGKLVGLDWFTHKTQAYFWGDQPIQYAADVAVPQKEQKLLFEVVRQLDEYFTGVRQVFDLPLDLSVGTEFQQQVWQALLTIPFGQTISYADLAKKIGKPTAYRACANANGKNPISLIVPCHRVIASGGAIGGYTGGVDIKQCLLMLENSKDKD